MILRKKGDYKVIVENRGTPVESEWLIVKSEKISDIVMRINAGEFTRLSFSKTDGYELNNADFLKDCNGLKGLAFGDADIVSPFDIYHLQELESFSSSFKFEFDIDFSRFPLLNSLGVDYSKHTQNIGNCIQLETLTLTNYKALDKDLSELQRLVNLKNFRLFKSNIESLNGIEGMVLLNDLMLYSLPKLTSIDKIQELSANLRTLELETCKSIGSYNCLSGLVNLEKAIISKCAPFDNLTFIPGMKKLKHFTFVDTDVVDGNLQWLAESKIEWIAFTDKKHFSHKYKFFEARSNS